MSTKKSYAELVKEAIVALKDRTGSSAQAIKAHITANNAGLNFLQVLAKVVSLLVISQFLSCTLFSSWYFSMLSEPP